MNSKVIASAAKQSVDRTGKIATPFGLAMTFLLFFISPSLATAWNPLDRFWGNRFYEKGEYPAASQKYGNVLHPGTAEDHYNSGDSLYKEGRYPEAEPHFLAALNSSNPELREKALYNLGNTKYREQKLQEAVDTYNKVLEMNSKNEKARKNRDFVLEQMKQKPPEQKQEDQKKDQQEEQKKQEQKENEQPSKDQQPEQQKEEQKPVTGQEAERLLNSIDDNPKGPLKEMIRQESNGKAIPAGKDW